MSARPIPAIAVLALSSAITSLDFTIIYLAIPRIRTAFAVSVADTQWVAASYAVAYGGFLLLGGRLSDAYGPRRLFLLGLVGFGICSALGGVAPTLAVLVAGRIGQGLSAAMLFPATLALLHQKYADSTGKRRALSTWAAAGSGGLIAGTVLGGVLTQLAGWRAVMWVNVPLVITAMILMALSLPREAGTRNDVGSPSAPGVGISSWVSSLSVAIVTASVCLVALRLQTWGPGWQTWIVVAVAGCAAIIARLLVRGSGITLIPARVARDAGVRTATVLGAVFMGAFGTVYFLLSLDLQTVRGIPPILTGLALIPGSVGGVIGSVVAARLLGAYPPRTVARGAMIAGGVGLACVAFGVTAPLPILLLVLAVSSIAQGVAYASTFALAGSTVQVPDQGVASGVASTGQQVGSAMGLAVAALCIQIATASGGSSGMRGGIVLALGIGAGAVFLSGLNRTKSRMNA